MIEVRDSGDGIPEKNALAYGNAGDHVCLSPVRMREKLLEVRLGYTLQQR